MAKETQQATAIAKILFESFQTADSDQATQAVIQSFIATLQKNNAVAQGQDIIATLERMFNEADGIVYATISSAVALSAEQKAELCAKLQQQHHATAIHAAYTIDSSLLGGIAVQVNDILYDNTLKHKLLTLSKTLTT